MIADLYLVRHGRASGNRQGRYVGRSDPPLTARGRREAEAVAAWFESLFASPGLRSAPQPRAVYSTGFRRADCTARRIARRLQIPLHVEKDLRELDFGQWEGKTYAEIMSSWPRRLWAWYEAPLEVSPPGGETLRDLMDRVWAAFCGIAADSGGGRAILVTHGGPIRALLALVKCDELDMQGAAEHFFSYSCRTGSVSGIRHAGPGPAPAHMRPIFYNLRPCR